MSQSYPLAQVLAVKKDRVEKAEKIVEVKTQALKVYQQEELKIQYIQQLVKKQGIDGALFQQLNAEYGCVLRESSLAGGVIWWTPTCQDNANWGQYLEAAKQTFLAQAWQVGDTVEVEWIISADGKQFDVTRERIRQIEAKALRKMRHPIRSKQLKAFLDLLESE